MATGCNSECTVSRTGGRLRQHTWFEPGTTWFCPLGMLEEDIEISEWQDVLHVYPIPSDSIAGRLGCSIAPGDTRHQRGGSGRAHHGWSP